MLIIISSRHCSTPWHYHPTAAYLHALAVTSPLAVRIAQVTSTYIPMDSWYQDQLKNKVSKT